MRAKKEKKLKEPKSKQPRKKRTKPLANVQTQKQKVSQIVKINLSQEKPKAKRSYKKREIKQQEKPRLSESLGVGSFAAPSRITFQEAYNRPYASTPTAVSEPVSELIPKSVPSGVSSVTASGVMPTTPLKTPLSIKIRKPRMVLKKAVKEPKKKAEKKSESESEVIPTQIPEPVLKRLISEGNEESENPTRVQQVGGERVLSMTPAAIRARERRAQIKAGEYVPRARKTQKLRQMIDEPPTKPSELRQMSDSERENLRKLIQVTRASKQPVEEEEYDSTFQPVSYPAMANPIAKFRGEKKEFLSYPQGYSETTANKGYPSLSSSEVDIRPSDSESTKAIKEFNIKARATRKRSEASLKALLEEESGLIPVAEMMKAKPYGSEMVSESLLTSQPVSNPLHSPAQSI